VYLDTSLSENRTWNLQFIRLKQ